MLPLLGTRLKLISGSQHNENVLSPTLVLICMIHESVARVVKGETTKSRSILALPFSTVTELGPVVIPF